MKLDAFDLHFTMAQAHDHTVVCLGRDFQAGRQALTFDNQRMITAGVEWRIKIAKDRPAVVNNLRRLPVDHSRRAHHSTAESFADGLMAQANTQYRNAIRKTFY